MDSFRGNASDYFQKPSFLKEKENEEKERELPLSSSNNSNKSCSNISTSNICKEVDLSAIPFEEMKKIYKDISQILYKSSFIYKNNRGIIEIKNENNIKDYDKFVEMFKQYKKIIYELFDNFSKLINYLDKVKENFKKEFKNRLIKLEIRMDLYRFKHPNNKYIYNINYDYKINNNYKNDIYTDTDIFENKEPKIIEFLIPKIKSKESVKKENNLNYLENERTNELGDINLYL